MEAINLGIGSTEVAGEVMFETTKCLVHLRPPCAKVSCILIILNVIQIGRQRKHEKGPKLVGEAYGSV